MSVVLKGLQHFAVVIAGMAIGLALLVWVLPENWR